MKRTKRSKAASEDERVARRREQYRAWYAKNRESQRARNAAYRDANPEKVRSYAQRVRQRFNEDPEAAREKARESMRAWRKKNPEKARQRSWKARGIPPPTRQIPETCECCGGPPRAQGVLHLDHCHETGEFRGWLCSKCNLGIGSLGDNLEALKRAVAYLKRHKKKRLY